MTSVLIVDDEPQILKTLSTNLRARGYDVLSASDGESALSVAAREHPDVVILDLGLPGMDGVEVIDGLRGWSEVPIIVLSAREQETDKVLALDAGADDYITKPFGMDELLARLRAAVRRGIPSKDEEPLIETLHFSIDLRVQWHASSLDGQVAQPGGSRGTLPAGGLHSQHRSPLAAPDPALEFRDAL